MEEIQPKWNSFSKDKQNRIKELLFREYNLKQNYEKQIFRNIKENQLFYKTYFKLNMDKNNWVLF